MARFERKIQKRLKAETEDFNVWFEKNKEHFPGFVNAESEEEEPQGTVKLKKKRLWIIPTAFVLVALCVFLCFLPMILKKDTVSSPSFFGDESVDETLLSEEEYQKILLANPFLLKEVGYKLAGLDSDDLYWYYMLTEKDGQRIYWEVHCFEESIEEFIQIVFED